MSEREQLIANTRQAIFSKIEELLGERDVREFDGSGLNVTFDLKCSKVVVERLVYREGQARKGYLVDLQGLSDPDRFAKTFGLDLKNPDDDQFFGTIMTSGDYQRLANLVSQLK